ncbi:hypothetical protein NM952_11050 [Pasteurella multocida subsp. multocida]|uniref:Uncharacterized protein n=1 Tax=Pasteurella multocida TaxID=747 RepID=A0A9X3ZMB8_PASMD|nr:hypothetical protein [Pasteurella multocida]MBF6981441.1 hypothetical protein [Pasteurella multocida]MDA5607150.1 hypothetical protein [Pasteurella multocida subsp. multocida]MDA5609746.1 hypothetical protein [Pasteurella multocida]MDA5612362.1 hypothetical protein [Pasteurella multocida]MDA5614902.1 hypothetical protein [Pasteurella multocida]
MKRLFTLIMIALLPVQVMSAASMAPIIAAAATTGTRSNQENDRDKADSQAQIIAITQGGLTVDADSGHVIIRCLWQKGGLCKIRGGKEGEGFISRRTDLILTPQEFAEREGYKKVHRITLLPLYREDWLALDVSKE